MLNVIWLQVEAARVTGKRLSLRFREQRRNEEGELTWYEVNEGLLRDLGTNKLALYDKVHCSLESRKQVVVAALSPWEIQTGLLSLRVSNMRFETVNVHV